MKHCVKNIILIAAMPLVCFCAKNDEFTQSGNGEIVKISAGLPETKVSLTPGTDPALALAWEDNDQIVVEGTSSSTFTLSEIVDAHKATFEGEAVSGSEFAVYYPSKDILTRSYEGQVQDGNASAAHLVYNAMVDGLSSYDSFTFNKVNGAIKLVVKVPSSVTEVSAISITSQTSAGVDQAVFYKTNDAEGEKTATLSLGFIEGTAPAEGVLTAYAMVSWNEVELAEGSRLAIKLTVPDKQCSYQKTIKVTTATTVAGGQTFIIDLSDANALKHVIAGKGTQSDPYLLYDAEDMREMNGLLVANTQTFFKMMADIDMNGIDWSPENQSSPYRKDIDFDGNGKTISNFSCTKSGVYSGFIGVLSGRIANVTFEKPVVEAKSKHSGIICGYAGSDGTLPAVVENVTINEGKITQTSGSHTGFIFGHSNVANCKYTNITIIDGTLNQNGIGDSGFIGGAQNKGATFTNCHASGTLTVKSDLSAAANATNICSGGILGYSANSTFTGCSFSGTINGGIRCGGIVGYNAVAGVNLSDCHVSDATINVVQIGSAAGDWAGGIIGDASDVTISECSFEGAVTAAGQKVGGIVGHLLNGTVKKCTVQTKDGSKITASGNNVGGVVGWNEKGDLSKCSVNMEINANVSYVGGIIGNFYEGTVSDCNYTGKITANNYAGGIAGSAGKTSTPYTTTKISGCFSDATITSSSGNVGGICGIIEQGQSDPSVIERCCSKGNITGNGSNTGGIIGYIKDGKISECWYSGNLTVKDNSGGIAGVQGTSSTSVIIENCYTTGTITNSGSQKCGGIAGECYQNSKIRNCYSTMSISGGGRVFGSIAGRFNNGDWNGSLTTDYNMEVTNCIAAGSINSTASNTDLGSSGAVLGSCPVNVAHYTNCWRKYGFPFDVKYATTGVGLVDQGYTVTTFTTGTYQQSGYTTNKNWYPYHASEASASALQAAYSGWTTSKTDAQITVSDIAAATNHSDSNAWKSDIWDFSGDYPTLKNNPEPTE